LEGFFSLSVIIACHGPAFPVANEIQRKTQAFKPVLSEKRASYDRIPVPDLRAIFQANPGNR